MTAWSVLLALIFSLLSDCTASSVQTYEVAKLTFRHGDRIESFFGAYAVPSASPRRTSVNGTDYHLKIDVENLKNEECKDRESVCDSGSPSYPGAYRVVCDGVSAQRVLNHCSGIEHLELLILCVSESRARELLTGEGLRVDSQRLTVILVNRSDDHLCPLYNPNYDILESTNVSVTVRYAGMDSFAPTTRPSLYPPFFDQTTTFYFVMFAFCLLLLLALVWFAFNYLKRCHNVLSRRQARLQLQTVTRRAVNHCTVRSYKKSKNLTDGFESEEERCAICLEEYKAKELLRQLACKHEFHKMCVDPWLMDKRTCPLCKLDIVAEFEGREQQQDSHPEVIVGERAGRSESRSSDDDETAFPFSPDGTPELDIEAGSVMS